MNIHLAPDGRGEFLVVPGPGEMHQAREYQPGHRKAIWIPAVPSSGTSLVAGTLARLGVDMGTVDNRANWNRGYQMFEDADASMFISSPNTGQDKLLKERLRLREYLNWRFWRNPDGRVGVKHLATHWMYDRDPASLPVEILSVHRPLEHSIIADSNRTATAKDRGISDNYFTAYAQANRSGGVAGNWWAKKVLEDHVIEPKLWIDFYEFLDHPKEHIEAIVQVFDLKPTEEQLNDALYHVKPRLRTV